jgi:ABC-type nitrate/sulfonate/bicarbonate transport system permease component
MKTFLHNSEYFIAPSLIILLWSVFSLDLRTRLILPTPQETFVVFAKILKDSQYYQDIWQTLFQSLLAFSLSAFLGIPIGLLIATSKRISRIVEPPIEFLRSIPSTSIFPLFLLIFGIGMNARIITATFVTIWLVIINTIYGMRHTTKSRQRSALLLGADESEIFLHVSLYEALPFILSALRLSISLSLVIIIVTEMLVGPQYGIGVRIFEFQQYFRVPELYVYLFTIGLLGYFVNRLFQAGEKKLVHWTNK